MITGRTSSGLDLCSPSASSDLQGSQQFQSVGSGSDEAKCGASDSHPTFMSIASCGDVSSSVGIVSQDASLFPRLDDTHLLPPMLGLDTLPVDNNNNNNKSSSVSPRQNSGSSTPLNDGISSVEERNIELEDIDDLIASDFAKKLYQLVDDSPYQSMIHWSSGDTSFVIENITEFARTVLPAVFKHSNFSSFVRQLNKYDFHKVRQPGESIRNRPHGGGSGSTKWEFCHANFRRGDFEALAKIHRKNVGSRKSSRRREFQSHTRLAADSNSRDRFEELSRTVANLANQQQSTHTFIKELVSEMHSIRPMLDSLYASFTQHHDMIQFAVAKLNPIGIEPASPSEERTRALTNISTSSSSIVNDLRNFATKFDAISDCLYQPSLPPHLAENRSRSHDSSASTSHVDVKNSTRHLDIWKVPPKILLVEDDPTCCKIAAKLLQLFGCQVSAVTDGLQAFNLISTNRYDAVLMDIVMPHFDGLSATHHIRKFDKATPIISMTSNTTESDCCTYLSTGMSDILAKPFTKRTLYEILTRHCGHLLKPTSTASNLLHGLPVTHAGDLPFTTDSS